MSRREYHHLYNYRWSKARKAFLDENPLCVEHKKRGKIVAANVVDHIVMHRGDLKLFWDTDNWQPLCKHCHDSVKQRYEKSGTVIGCDVDGTPIDPNHHWK